MNGNHRYLRETFKWGTYGVNGDEPLKWIILKDIHDDHLENILIMMRQHTSVYKSSTMMTMVTEQEFRRIKKIRVPFKFGH